MAISDEITRLQNAKSALKTAIEGKGVSVPSGTKLDGYADLVNNIQQGGGDGVYIYVSLSRKGTTPDNPYIIQIDDVPTFVEVREKADSTEYFCFERISNGKKSAVLTVADESVYYYKGSAHAEFADYMFEVNTAKYIKFN